MSKLIKGFCAIFLGLIIWPNAYAQDIEQCEQNLKTAYSDYEAGQFAKCASDLETCAKKLHSSAYEAYRLIALSYMQLNDNQKADKAVRALLKAKPDYKTFPMFDPAQFNVLLKKYDVWPGTELGIRTNININAIRIIQNYAINNSAATFHAKWGFQTGINMEYFVKKNISIGAAISYEGLAYSRTAEDLLGWNQEFSEKLKYLSIPITANYYLNPEATWNFGFEIGLQPQFLHQTNSNVILKNPEGSPLQNTMSQLDQRNKTNLYGLAGIIAKRKVGSGTMVTGVRFAYGFNNIVNPDKRYDNLNFTFDNQYVDSDIAFMPLYFTLGYQFSLAGMYKVERLKD